MSDEDRDLINRGSQVAKNLAELAKLPTEDLTLICSAHERNFISGLRFRILREELKKR